MCIFVMIEIELSITSPETVQDKHQIQAQIKNVFLKREVNREESLF